MNCQSWQSHIQKENTNSIKKEQLFVSVPFNMNKVWKTKNILIDNNANNPLKKENSQVDLPIRNYSINKDDSFLEINKHKHINTSENTFSSNLDVYNDETLSSKLNSKINHINYHSDDSQSSSYFETNPVSSRLLNASLMSTKIPTIWSELSELKVRVKKLEIADKWRKSYKFDNLVTFTDLPENLISNNLVLNQTKNKTSYPLLYASLEKMKSNGVSKELWIPLEHIINEILTFQNNNCKKTKNKIEDILRNLTELSLAIYDYHQNITELNSSEKKKMVNRLLFKTSNEQNITPFARKFNLFTEQLQKNKESFQTFNTIKNTENEKNSDYQQSTDFQSHIDCNYNNNKYKNNFYSTYFKPKILETTTNLKTPFNNENKITSPINTNIDSKHTIFQSNFIDNSKYKLLSEF
ncbi:hypothetical protein PCK1_002851 [Pneumocystis canis]|nr:hypothetical protein PCK1_002851 [Pneumocystis canis]